MRRRLITALASIAVLAVAGCGDDDEGNGGDATTTVPVATQAETTAAEPPASGCRQVPQPATKKDGGEQKPEAELSPDRDYRVTFKTNCGSFTVDVDEEGGLTAASFVQLAENGFYKNTFFHRIVPDFVIQGGDPTGSGLGGPGYTTRDAPPRTLKYKKGDVAMAKAGAEPSGSAGSQFFVVLSARGASILTPDYALVGEVVDGMDVVERIGLLGDAADRPTQTVAITKATVRGG